MIELKGSDCFYNTGTPEYGIVCGISSEPWDPSQYLIKLNTPHGMRQVTLSGPIANRFSDKPDAIGEGTVVQIDMLGNIRRLPDTDMVSSKDKIEALRAQYKPTAQEPV